MSDGFGIETDIRDLNGELVISHDLAIDGALSARDILAPFAGTQLALALNIKSDGLCEHLEELLAEHNLFEQAFVFDMSVPDMRRYLSSKVRVFGRLSEVEHELPWADKCDGVWLDGFESTWFDATTITEQLQAGRDVCIVSPELHRRDHRALWDMLHQFKDDEHVFICTDYVRDAREHFQ